MAIKQIPSPEKPSELGLLSDAIAQFAAETRRKEKLTPRQLRIETALLDNQKIMDAAKSFYIVFKYNPLETFEETAATFDEAVVIAKQMNSDLGKFGKRAGIYAVDENGHRDIVTYLDLKDKASISEMSEKDITNNLPPLV
jgi:hypothetical protein